MSANYKRIVTTVIIKYRCDRSSSAEWRMRKSSAGVPREDGQCRDTFFREHMVRPDRCPSTVRTRNVIQTATRVVCVFVTLRFTPAVPHVNGNNDDSTYDTSYVHRYRYSIRFVRCTSREHLLSSWCDGYAVKTVDPMCQNCDSARDTRANFVPNEFLFLSFTTL